MNIRRTGNLLTILLHLLLLGTMPMADALAAEQAFVTQCASDDDRGGECDARHAHTGCEFCAALRAASVRAGSISFIAAPAPAVPLNSADPIATQGDAQLASTLGARAPPALRV